MFFEGVAARAEQCRYLPYPHLTVFVTRGGAGSLIATSARVTPIPAFPVAVVDSIGAGDALHGAFLYTHVILGWQLEQAGLFASAAAALSCTQAGARAGLPDMGQVIAFLRERRPSADLV